MQLYPGQRDKYAVLNLKSYEKLVSHLVGLGIAGDTSFSVMNRDETGLGVGISLISLTVDGVDVSIRDSVNALPFTGILRVKAPGWDSARLYCALRSAIERVEMDHEEAERLRALFHPPVPRLREGKISKELVEAVLGEDAAVRRILSLCKK
ncbi:MAG TPA: hypothetical protein VHB93_02290 [Candidatus Paceibacterota bacterium]|nr:hypothetical protein [Candidatus Paceibacterota bacterium]